MFETGFLAEHPSLASTGTTPRSLTLQMLVQRIRLTTNSLAFVRIPMLRPRPHLQALSAVARPGITPWFHVEQRRPLARISPCPASSAADRASARTANSTPQGLGRPHHGYPVAACLEAAFLRPTMAQPESLEACENWTHGSWPLTSTEIRCRRVPGRGAQPPYRPRSGATPLMPHT